MTRRLAILTDGKLDPYLAKTAVGVLRYCPEVVSAQVIEQASGLCVTCGTACRRCHPPQPERAGAKREQLTAMVQILLDTGTVRCRRCDPHSDD